MNCSFTQFTFVTRSQTSLHWRFPLGLALINVFFNFILLKSAGTAGRAIGETQKGTVVTAVLLGENSRGFQVNPRFLS